MLKVYTVLQSYSGLPETALSMPAVPVYTQQQPVLILTNILQLPWFLFTSHECSPQLEEWNNGFYDTAMSHQKKQGGSISSLSEISPWPQLSFPNTLPTKSINKDILSQHKTMGSLWSIIKFPFIFCFPKTHCSSSLWPYTAIPLSLYRSYNRNRGIREQITMYQAPRKHFMWIATLSPHNTAAMLLLSILQNLKTKKMEVPWG